MGISTTTTFGPYGIPDLSGLSALAYGSTYSDPYAAGGYAATYDPSAVPVTDPSQAYMTDPSQPTQGRTF